jgi:hypothetical protein
MAGIRIRGSNSAIQDNTTNANREPGIDVGGNQGDPENTAINNTIQSNTALNNVLYDLSDRNTNCDNNTWKSNTFGTSDQACIQ